MEFELITNDETWEALRPEWTDLLKHSITRVPFLNFDYQFAWWKTLGGGEWSPANSRLSIVVARQNGLLVGIAPFFVSSRGEEREMLHFIGEVEVSDYLDFIVDPTDLDRFLVELLTFLRLSPQLADRPLGLSNFISDSRSLEAIPLACAKSGWDCKISKLQPSPYIQVGESYEAFLASLNKKQRHEVRRKERNAEANYQTSWYLVQDAATLEDELQAFIDMMREDPSKQDFLTDLMVQHLKETARLAFKASQLHLAFLTFNQVKVAAYYSIFSEGKLWVYNSAWKMDYSPASPGWVLLAKIIRWACDNGVHEVDLMRGDEEYKYRFGGIDRFVLRAECFPLQDPV